jgi:hypothetical protein
MSDFGTATLDLKEKAVHLTAFSKSQFQNRALLRTVKLVLELAPYRL